MQVYLRAESNGLSFGQSSEKCTQVLYWILASTQVSLIAILCLDCFNLVAKMLLFITKIRQSITLSITSLFFWSSDDHPLRHNILSIFTVRHGH